MPLLPQPTPASAPTEAPGRVFEACAAVPAPPQDVLRALTDPEVLAHWSPLPFEVQDLEGGRLRPGASASVCGQLAGVRALFRVHVTKADDEGLELTAHGPVDLDVSYCFHAAPPASTVQAKVAVHRHRGLGGALLGRATECLLAGGALEAAMTRLASEIETGREPALALAC